MAQEFEIEIDRCLAEGKRIQAIELLREHTGVGLADAKHWVDARARGERVPPAASAPSSAARPPDRALEGELLELLREGETLRAIREWHDRTGDPLKRSREAVEALALAHGIDIDRTFGAWTFAVAAAIAAALIWLAI